MLRVVGFDPSIEAGDAGPAVDVCGVAPCACQAVACCRPSDRSREVHLLLRVAETRKGIEPEARSTRLRLIPPNRPTTALIAQRLVCNDNKCIAIR